MMNRTLELARGAEPDYEPISLHYVGGLDLTTTHRAMHAFREAETAAWAKAECCFVRDVVNLLNRDSSALDRWTLFPVSHDPKLLQTKYHLLAYLAKGVHRASIA